jgi:hypothetical protein
LKQNDSIFQHISEMDDPPEDEGKYQTYCSDRNCWPSHLEHKFRSLSLTKREEDLDSSDSSLDCREADPSFQASQILWSTGSLSTPIPNGFYSIIPVSKWNFCTTLICQKIQITYFCTLFHLYILKYAGKGTQGAF